MTERTEPPMIDRARYAALYGPTRGDRIRLADTDLYVEITEDLSMGPAGAGDEVVFGGGKVIRESMGQARATRAEGAPDLVITGASDYHGTGKVDHDLGCNVTSPAEYERLLARAADNAARARRTVAEVVR